MRKKAQAEFVQWMGPILDCLRAVGGTAKPREVSDWIARECEVPASIVDALMKSGEQRFHNQVLARVEN